MLPLAILGAIIVILLLIFILPGFFVIGARDVGLMIRKNFGTRLPEGHIVATKGEIGIQAQMLRPGFYWRFPILWSVKHDKIIVIPPGSIGLVKSVDGTALPPGKVLGDDIQCDSFQDTEKFLTDGGFRGPQVGFLRPGTYRINTMAFTVEQAKATIIPEEKIGIVTAHAGTPLPAGYIVAPRPIKDGKEVADPGIFQKGQEFLDCGGYQGPQLDTLQPGTYYINTMLFEVLLADVAIVEPGYVAVIRSNVGKELEHAKETPAGPEDETLKGTIHAEIERLLTLDKNIRGIWKEPIAPGKYNLNTIAFTPYQVPTSAVTIDWAHAGKIGTEVKGGADEGVLYHFDPLKVTSMDGFLLEVNVRMVIRITPENAAFIIARFGSVNNLIDQIVHPLIDSSFRNKAGEKKAIDFFQSRSALQKEALEHAKTVFEEYSVEAQNLLVAYIDIPASLLDTQTQKEIALQQQTQYAEQAKAQEKNIEVQEKTARALKQSDVVNSELTIKIKDNMAQARIKEAAGEAEYLEKTNAATGKGIAAGLQAQQDALGKDGTALLNIYKALAEKNIAIVPQVLVTGGGGADGGIYGLLGSLTAKAATELTPKVTK